MNRYLSPALVGEYQTKLPDKKLLQDRVRRLFDGAYLKELSKIERQDALILDDFGVQPFDTGSRALLLDIIEDRHGKSSTIITVQVPVKKWNDVNRRENPR